MVVPITYTSSRGKTYQLQADGLRTKEANFHTWAYTPLGVDQQYGKDIQGFKKEAATYSMTLVCAEPLAARRTLINTLHNEWENDLLNTTPGRITWGECYLDCYVVKSDTYPDSDGWRTDIDITVYAPNPFWQSPLVIDSPAGTQTVRFDAGTILPQDFRLEIYGPGNSGLNIYQRGGYRLIRFVDGLEWLTLDSDEYIIIDTRDYITTIYRDGATENAFPIFVAADKATQYDQMQCIHNMTVLKLATTAHVILTIYREVSEPWIS